MGDNPRRDGVRSLRHLDPLAQCVESEQRREVQPVGIQALFDDPIALVVAEPSDGATRVSDVALAAAAVVYCCRYHLAQCVCHRGELTVLVVRILGRIAAPIGDAGGFIVACARRNRLHPFGCRHRYGPRCLVVGVSGLVIERIGDPQYPAKRVVVGERDAVKRIGHQHGSAAVLIRGRRDVCPLRRSMDRPAESVIFRARVRVDATNVVGLRHHSAVQIVVELRRGAAALPMGADLRRQLTVRVVEIDSDTTLAVDLLHQPAAAVVFEGADLVEARMCQRRKRRSAGPGRPIRRRRSANN